MSAVHLEKMLRSLGNSDVAEVPCLTLEEWSLRHFRQGTPPLAPEHRGLHAVRSCPLVTSKDDGRASERAVRFSHGTERRRRSSSAEAATLAADDSQSGRRSPIYGALKVLRRWKSVVHRGSRGGSMRTKKTESTLTVPVTHC